MPDLVAGYGIAEKGAIALIRGNRDSLYRWRAEATVDSPFHSVARVFTAPSSPELLVTGDFDADGHQDVLMGRRLDEVLHLLPGDGRGGLGAPRPLPLTGRVETLAAGDFDPRDGLVDLAVSVRGPAHISTFLFGGPEGAFLSHPRRASDSDDHTLPNQAARGPVLAMRLNEDALADLVVLAEESSLPGVSLSVAAATFLVTNVNDSGAGSLRQAILDANASPGADAIHFNIPGPGIHTIRVSTPLPVVSGPVAIDGTTQPSYAGTPMIELSGAAVTSATGLEIVAGTSVVRGLAINRFGNGIVLTTNGGNIIEGNFIGTDPSGTMDLGNAFDGVRVGSGDGNTIGGTTEAARNVISGNDNFGVTVVSSGNLIGGNFIGTDRAGTGSLSNTTGVMTVTGTNASNTIGGLATGSGNVISGNRGSGVSLGGTLLGHLVQGNFIGTDATGTADLGNGGDGVAIQFGSCCNTIGGTAPGAGNVISGNAGSGLRSDYHPNTIRGNLIGTRADGAGPLGNDGHGVLVNFMSDHTVGGAEPGAGNTIAFNGGDGVALGNAGTGNSVLSNSIHSNGGLGIDLGPNGVTSNDPGDSDSGANGLQNFPLLTAARNLGDGTILEGMLDSRPGTTFRLEFFSGASCDPFGNGEGEEFIGASPQTTGADGKVAFILSSPIAIAPGIQVTASATDPGNNTSEFSPCRQVVCAATIPAGSPVLQFRDDLVTWNALAGVGAYDLVRGDLEILRATSGDFTASTLECVGDDVPAAAFPTGGNPPPGVAFWFLVRGVTCSGNGTYDSGHPSQSGSRDVEIDASPHACR